MNKRDFWQIVVKILIYALSAFGGAYSATSCTFNATVDSVSNATAHSIVPCETAAKDSVFVWE